MQRKRLLLAVTLLAILLSILVMVVPGSHAMARNTIFIETPTATPDANQILNQANTVAAQADHTATEAQNTLTVLNFVLALFSVIIGILGLVSGALVAYAFRVINRYRKQLDEGHAEMVKMRTAMNNTQKAVVYLGLGDRLYNQDRKQEAVAIYRKVGSFLPGDAEIHNVLGRIYSGTGYYEDAIKSFETTLAADPNFAEAHMEIGLAYRRQGDAQKGPDAETLRKADYDKARIRIMNAGRSPEIYWDYYDLALAQLVSGTVGKSETTKDEAIESYKTAIHLTPGIVQFDSVLNNLYLLQKAQERIHRLDTVISMLEAAKSK